MDIDNTQKNKRILNKKNIFSIAKKSSVIFEKEDVLEALRTLEKEPKIEKERIFSY